MRRWLKSPPAELVKTLDSLIANLYSIVLNTGVASVNNSVLAGYSYS